MIGIQDIQAHFKKKSNSLIQATGIFLEEKKGKEIQQVQFKNKDLLRNVDKKRRLSDTTVKTRSEFDSLDKIGVPEEFREFVAVASEHTGLPASDFAKLMKSENASFDPTKKGLKDPDDFGLTQLSPEAVSDITSQRGRDYFKDNFGVDFNIENPQHQILGAAVLMNLQQQFDFPKFGIPDTRKNRLLAFNLGGKRLSSILNGNGSSKDRDRMQGYLDLLKRNGIKF